MRIFKVLAAASIIAAIAACGPAGMEKPSDLNGVKAPSSVFDKELFRLYRWLAEREANEGDYTAAEQFVKRAKAAASGSPSAPEAISARALPSDKVGELTSARRRLTDALAGGAATDNPVYAAFAQAMFDCWMQEQEENFQPGDISMCKECFEAAMKALGQPMAKPMAQMVAPGCEVRAFLVFFDFNSADVGDEGDEVINLAVEHLQQTACRAANIDVIGHTDTMGSKAYNQALSLRRADAVVNKLTTKGISIMAISTGAQGEDKLRVATADETRESENRRVEINIK